MTVEVVTPPPTTDAVARPLPPVLFLEELVPILRVGVRKLYTMQARGELAVFELKPRIGGKPRYSGKRLQQYLDGELSAEGVAPRHYFGTARR